MPSPAVPSLAEQIAAAQDWWREAGVDFAFVDDARGWLAEVAPPDLAPGRMPPDPGRDTAGGPAPNAPAAAPSAPKIGGDRANWPQDLAAFQRWWLEEPSLDPGGTHPRVAPRGPQGAPMAILVPMPEAQDGETLLAGAQGQLVTAIAKALGFAPDTLYLAAALPRHTVAADWAGMAAAGLGDVLLHQLALAAPKRLLVLGNDVLPLLGHDPAQAAPAVSKITIQGSELPLLASFQPARLLQRAAWRAGLWQRLLQWTDGDTQ